MRAHYTYIFDKDFDNSIEQLKKKHEKDIALLLENISNCKDMEQRYNAE